jgi:hypothetical protein
VRPRLIFGGIENQAETLVCHAKEDSISVCSLTRHDWRYRGYKHRGGQTGLGVLEDVQVGADSETAVSGESKRLGRDVVGLSVSLEHQNDQAPSQGWLNLRVSRSMLEPRESLRDSSLSFNITTFLGISW